MPARSARLLISVFPPPSRMCSTPRVPTAIICTPPSVLPYRFTAMFEATVAMSTSPLVRLATSSLLSLAMA